MKLIVQGQPYKLLSDTHITVQGIDKRSGKLASQNFKPSYVIWPVLFRWIASSEWSYSTSTAAGQCAKGVSWAELCIAFHCQTGISIAADRTLRECAKIFATCFRRAIGCMGCSHYKRAGKALFHGKNKVDATQQLLGFKLPGIDRRPIWPLGLSLHVALELTRGMAISGNMEEFGQLQYSTSPGFKVDRFKQCAQDTITSLEIACLASSVRSAAADTTPPRYIRMRKLARCGPCHAGCTVTPNLANGKTAWRAAPVGNCLFPDGVTVCESHYKKALAHKRKLHGNSSGRGRSRHCTVGNNDIVGDTNNGVVQLGEPGHSVVSHIVINGAPGSKRRRIAAEDAPT